jgi:two-component system, LytTR family, sensor kinase
MKKSVLYFLHAIVIIIFIYGAVSNLRSITSQYHEPLASTIRDCILLWGSILSLIYFSYWLFPPKYLIKKEYLKFFGSILIIVLGFTFYINALGFFINHILKARTHIFDFGWMFGLWVGWSFFFGLVGTLLRLFVQWIMEVNSRIELKKQQIKSELSMLKNQLNPHFLFNTLNNIDSLIGDPSSKASQALNMLSEIMRYMVYDSEKDFVPLHDEIKYIQNFIELQKLRVENDEIINFSIKGDIANIIIAPMLFIPFVENAFKHSSLKDNQDNEIRIHLDIIGNKLRFHCFNTISETYKDKTHGIGMENVKKRLELIYAGNYNLVIDNSLKSYTVNLDINL